MDFEDGSALARLAKRIWEMGQCASTFSSVARFGRLGAYFKHIGYKLERSFFKDLSNSLKSRAAALHPSHFATLLQNNEKFLRV